MNTTVYRSNNLFDWRNAVKRRTITLSKHAQMRRKQMGVTEDRINTVLSDPETVYPGGLNHPGSRVCYQRDDLVVVVDSMHNEVVTVLYHRAEGRD